MSKALVQQEEKAEVIALCRAVDREEMIQVRALILPLVSELGVHHGWCGSVKGGIYNAWLNYEGRGVYGLVGIKTLQLVGGN